MKKQLYVVTVFFGQPYAQMMAFLSWPSLYKHNPDVFADYDVSHHVYCRELDMECLAGYRRALDKIGVTLNITCSIPNLPGTGDSRTRLRNEHIWRCLVNGMETSLRDDAIMLYLLPDHIIGHGLGNLLKRLKPGGYLVCAHPRFSHETATRELVDILNKGEGFRDNCEMVRFFMEKHRHPLVSHGLSFSSMYWRGQDNGNYYSVNFRDPVPVLINPTEGLIKHFREHPLDKQQSRFEMIDHGLVDYALANGLLDWVTDSNEFFWAELSSRYAYNPEPYNARKASEEYRTVAGELMLHTEVKFWKESVV